MRRWAGLLCLALATAAQAASPARPSLPGIGPSDPRIRVDPNAPPWRAIGKLQATAGSLYESCTGTLVGPRTILTAAHCLYNLRTRRNFPPSSLHFLVGYDAGAYSGHAVVTRFEIGPGYDGKLASAGSDWAALTLDHDLGTPDRVLAVGPPPAAGTRVMIGGYSQDHPLTLTADTQCHIVRRIEDANGRALLRHDCTATHGASGAPVLYQEGGTWRIGAVDIAASNGAASGLAAVPGPFKP